MPDLIPGPIVRDRTRPVSEKQHFAERDGSAATRFVVCEKPKRPLHRNSGRGTRVVRGLLFRSRNRHENIQMDVCLSG